MKKIILTSVITGTALFANTLDTVKDAAADTAKVEATQAVVKKISETTPAAPVEQVASSVVEDKAVEAATEVKDKAVESAKDVVTEKVIDTIK